MRYEIRFKETGFLKEATDDKVGAMLTAVHMGNWNHPCDVIDTQTGDTVFECAAYLAPISSV
jgi:lauroyl/myristoyl acyltransferase